jgi:YHS domain-containing protein
MKVDKSKALTAEFNDHTYYFCSEHCRHSFEETPSTASVGRPRPPGRTRPPTRIDETR